MVVKPLELEGSHEVEQSLDLAEVYREHASTVTRWATRLSGSPQDAGDLTQEVFCVVQRRLSGFRPREASLETWLFRITENVVRSRRRRERMKSFFFGGKPELGDEVADGRPGAEALLMQRADVAQVYRVLDGLKDEDRTMLVLFELEGYAGAKVAELMGLSADVIWVRLHRARQRFLKRLQSLEPEVA